MSRIGVGGSKGGGKADPCQTVPPVYVYLFSVMINVCNFSIQFLFIIFEHKIIIILNSQLCTKGV